MAYQSYTIGGKMAPRQTTIQQSEAMVRQILTLIDALDYKTLQSLFSLYLGRVKAEEELIRKCGAEGREIDQPTLSAHRNAFYDVKLVQLINKFKKARRQLREE